MRRDFVEGRKGGKKRDGDERFVKTWHIGVLSAVCGKFVLTEFYVKVVA